MHPSEFFYRRQQERFGKAGTISGKIVAEWRRRHNNELRRGGTLEDPGPAAIVIPPARSRFKQEK